MSVEQNVTDAPVSQGVPASSSSASQGDDGQEFGSNVAHGMGQSKSSRRRRRKRKKGPEGGPGGEQAADSGAGEGAVSGMVSIQAGGATQAPMQRAAPPQPGSFQAGASQQQNNSNGAGAKRWKKKFRDRDRARPADGQGSNGSSQGFSGGAAGSSGAGTGGGFRDATTHQPGNGGGFKRKGGGGGGKQQRGPRSFVGPMDHSYRVANGNFADTPPSTINTSRGGGGGGRGYQSDSQPIDYSQGRTVPIAADAQTKIFFFIEDLFFIAKIQETARKIGVKVEFVKNDKDAIAALTNGEEADRPGLIVFDLNNANVKPLTLIPKLKAKLKRSTSIIGFLSHLQGDLKAKAVEAGCDTVMPRAAFSQNLPNLLRRYGIEDEEEGNFNQ